jgi:glycosyltransferase involved in cell wall biosynthesis
MTMLGEMTWPRISIVTPSYNQGQFIEETIRSVLLQGYPNLEYIIIDGGSTDASVDIIKKYEPWLTYWVSEKDQGQTHALNKGFAHASGVIYGFLNSDDLLQPRALYRVAIEMVRVRANWLSGGCLYMYEGESLAQAQLWVPRQCTSIARWIAGYGGLPQRSTFWRSELAKAAGLFREDMHYAFDDEYWIRLLSLGYRYQVIEAPLAIARLHDQSKTMSSPQAFQQDRAKIEELYLPRLDRRGQHTLRRLRAARQIQEQSAAYFILLETEGRWAALREATRLARQYGTAVLNRPYLGMLRRVLT